MVAVPSRSTARIAPGAACTGDRPAVWTTVVTGPASAAAPANLATEAASETSTSWVMT